VKVSDIYLYLDSQPPVITTRKGDCSRPQASLDQQCLDLSAIPVLILFYYFTVFAVTLPISSE